MDNVPALAFYQSDQNSISSGGLEKLLSEVEGGGMKWPTAKLRLVAPPERVGRDFAPI